MTDEEISKIAEELDHFIYDISEKYNITTILTVAYISARLYGITKEEYPDHDAIPLLDKMVDSFKDVVEVSMTIPTDGAIDAPIA
jgi:hypothetical protein